MCDHRKYSESGKSRRSSYHDRDDRSEKYHRQKEKEKSPRSPHGSERSKGSRCKNHKRKAHDEYHHKDTSAKRPRYDENYLHSKYSKTTRRSHKTRSIDDERKESNVENRKSLLVISPTAETIHYKEAKISNIPSPYAHLPPSPPRLIKPAKENSGKCLQATMGKISQNSYDKEVHNENKPESNNTIEDPPKLSEMRDHIKIVDNIGISQKYKTFYRDSKNGEDIKSKHDTPVNEGKLKNDNIRDDEIPPNLLAIQQTHKPKLRNPTNELEKRDANMTNLQLFPKSLNLQCKESISETFYQQNKTNRTRRSRFDQQTPSLLGYNSHLISTKKEIGDSAELNGNISFNNKEEIALNAGSKNSNKNTGFSDSLGKNTNSTNSARNDLEYMQTTFKTNSSCINETNNKNTGFIVTNNSTGNNGHCHNISPNMNYTKSNGSSESYGALLASIDDRKNTGVSTDSRKDNIVSSASTDVSKNIGFPNHTTIDLTNTVNQVSGICSHNGDKSKAIPEKGKTFHHKQYNEFHNIDTNNLKNTGFTNGIANPIINTGFSCNTTNHFPNIGIENVIMSQFRYPPPPIPSSTLDKNGNCSLANGRSLNKNSSFLENHRSKDIAFRNPSHNNNIHLPLDKNTGYFGPNELFKNNNAAFGKSISMKGDNSLTTSADFISKNKSKSLLFDNNASDSKPDHIFKNGNDNTIGNRNWINETDTTLSKNTGFLEDPSSKDIKLESVHPNYKSFMFDKNNGATPIYSQNTFSKDHYIENDKNTGFFEIPNSKDFISETRTYNSKILSVDRITGSFETKDKCHDTKGPNYTPNTFQSGLFNISRPYGGTRNRYAERSMEINNYDNNRNTGNFQQPKFNLNKTNDYTNVNQGVYNPSSENTGTLNINYVPNYNNKKNLKNTGNPTMDYNPKQYNEGITIHTPKFRKSRFDVENKGGEVKTYDENIMPTASFNHVPHQDKVQHPTEDNFKKNDNKSSLQSRSNMNVDPANNDYQSKICEIPAISPSLGGGQEHIIPNIQFGMRKRSNNGFVGPNPNGKQYPNSNSGNTTKNVPSSNQLSSDQYPTHLGEGHVQTNPKFSYTQSGNQNFYHDINPAPPVEDINIEKYTKNTTNLGHKFGNRFDRRQIHHRNTNPAYRRSQVNTSKYRKEMAAVKLNPKGNFYRTPNRLGFAKPHRTSKASNKNNIGPISISSGHQRKQKINNKPQWKIEKINNNLVNNKNDKKESPKEKKPKKKNPKKKSKDILSDSPDNVPDTNVIKEPHIDINKEVFGDFQPIAVGLKKPPKGHLKPDPEIYWKQWWSLYGHVEKSLPPPIDANDEVIKSIFNFPSLLSDSEMRKRKRQLMVMGVGKIMRHIRLNEKDYALRDIFNVLKYKHQLEDPQFQKHLSPKEFKKVEMVLKNARKKTRRALFYQNMICRWHFSMDIVKRSENGETVKSGHARKLLSNKVFHYLVWESVQELKKLIIEDWPGFDEFYKTL
ncbi:uncharacterized protein LOC142226386 [Haematobia irritans]|uniref:uncharacterized protein LOC142226386 n=1 Tax=Haematobia irritans TaxID=7368 RepID=UPI003F508AA6